MTSRKRQCPKKQRLQRHCLESLEIPCSHPCISPSPPACQVPPPACQIKSRLRSNCQDPKLSCQDQPTASQIKHPACHIQSPAWQLKPRLCLESPPPCQVRHPICQVKPLSCPAPHPSCLFHQAEPPACQLPAGCQFPSSTSPNQTPPTMKHPIYQWDPDFCTSDTCDSTNCRTRRQSPTPFRQGSTDEDDVIMYSDCFGPCTQLEGGCENMEENDLDFPHSRDRSRNNNNQQDKSHNEEEYNRAPVSYPNMSSRNQNANTVPSYRNDEEDVSQTQNIPHKECVTKSCQNKCFPDATGSANREIISNLNNLNNHSAKTNFRSTGSFSISEKYRHSSGNKIPNDVSNSRISRSSQNINKTRVSEENIPKISDHDDSSGSWKTIPCCQQEYSQEQALQPNSLENENYFQYRREFDNEQDRSKTNGKICHDCCEKSDDEMTKYPTRPHVENISIDKNFKQNVREEIRPRIVASPCPRSALKSPSNMRSASGAKVQYMAPRSTPVQEPSNGTFMDCNTCCDTSDSRSNNKVNKLQEKVSPVTDSEFQSEHLKSRFADQSGQIVFENSVPIKGPKQLANCCNHGISEVLEPLLKENQDAECSKKEACVHEVGASSCASASCVANKTDSGCRCRYPPAFKQFSCAGNINGTCNCSDKSKI